MANVDIIQLRKEDGTPFYPNIARQPIVIGGLYWIWNPAIRCYSKTTLMATGDGHNLFALTQSPQVIQHNMGTKPHVTIIALEGNELHEVIADVLYANNNEVAIQWNAGPTMAYAYIA